MGDVVQPAAGSESEFPAIIPGVGHTHGQGHAGYPQGTGASDPQSVFPSQFQQHQYGSQPQHQNAFASQYDMTAQQPTQGRGMPGPYNMATMMHALPQANYRPGQQRYNASTPGATGQPMAQVSPFVASAAMNTMPAPQYFMSQHGHMTHYYAPTMPASQQQQDGMSARAAMPYYQHQHAQPQYYYHHGAQFANNGPVVQNPMVAGEYAPTAPQHSTSRLAQQQVAGQGGGANFYQPQAQVDGVTTDSRSSVVRGPPRKPKQSGHAIWIGNLPPQTELMSLVYHVCKEAPGLQSLFLISKSNCAFANFTDEPACVAAQQKIHDSKFHSVRLVSRLRKSTVEGASGVTAPTGPSASTPQSATSQETAGDGPTAAPGVATPSEDGGAAPVASPETTPQPGPGSSTPPQKDKYFILKSLTVEDLEQSVQTGIWATQSHNEKALNNAFLVAESVYLIFSANKSGEYFGYARMTSQINDDPAAAIEFAPKAQSATDVGLPKAIPTEANEFMPKGNIMDDSERGTIFWEAELDEDAEEEDSTAGGEGVDDSGSSRSVAGDGAESKAWGKPFHLEWVSTSRLPFYRTRGLRNPWNSNKEIKIARDGTELEPTIGRKLTALFSPRPQGAAGGAGTSGMRQQMAPMMPGYHAMRPLYQQ